MSELSTGKSAGESPPNWTYLDGLRQADHMGYLRGRAEERLLVIRYGARRVSRMVPVEDIAKALHVESVSPRTQSPLLDAQNRVVHEMTETVKPPDPNFDPSDELYEAKREGDAADMANEAHLPVPKNTEPRDG